MQENIRQSMEAEVISIFYMIYLEKYDPFQTVA